MMPFMTTWRRSLETDKIGVIGLARKAGKVILGYDMVYRNRRKCLLLLIASDISPQTRKNIEKLGIRILNTELMKIDLGKAVGAEKVAVIGITDENFAKMFI